MGVSLSLSPTDPQEDFPPTQGFKPFLVWGGWLGPLGSLVHQRHPRAGSLSAAARTGGLPNCKMGSVGVPLPFLKKKPGRGRYREPIGQLGTPPFWLRL